MISIKSLSPQIISNAIEMMINGIDFNIIFKDSTFLVQEDNTSFVKCSFLEVSKRCLGSNYALAKHALEKVPQTINDELMNYILSLECDRAVFLFQDKSIVFSKATDKKHKISKEQLISMVVDFINKQA